MTEVGTLVAVQHAASQNLANPGHNQAAEVGKEHGMNAGAQPGTVAQRSQSLAPAECTEYLCRNAKGKAQQHPRPRHVCLEYRPHLVPLEAAVHPP